MTRGTHMYSNMIRKDLCSCYFRQATTSAFFSALQAYPHQTLQCLVYSAVCGEDMLAAQENTLK